MNAATLEKLESIKLRRTRYEVTATHKDGRVLFMGYALRKSKDGIFDLVSARGPENIIRMGLDDSARMVGLKGCAIQVGPWRVAFTGRTQRDAIVSGELSWS